MNSIEKMLPCDIFRRIHRSYIVSLLHVDKFDNNTVSIDSKKLPIGKHYREGFLVDIIVLCTDEKSSNGLSNGDINKLLRNLNPQ